MINIEWKWKNFGLALLWLNNKGRLYIVIGWLCIDIGAKQGDKQWPSYLQI